MEGGLMKNNKLPNNLPQLQNLIKRDPVSYTEEFNRQYLFYKETLEIFKQGPELNNDRLYELVMFLSQIAQCYPDQLKHYPNELVGLLHTYSTVLHPALRMGLVKALILLRNKGLVPPTLLLTVCFELLHCKDKVLRQTLQLHIIQDIKNVNAKSKNTKLNKELQNFMFDMMQGSHAPAVKMALDVLIELYRKKIWNDEKTVNIIASACFSKITKVMVAAMKFFVGRDEDIEKQSSQTDSDSEGEETAAPNLKATLMSMRVNKKTKNKRQAKLQKMKIALAKTKKKNRTNLKYDFSALHLIHDPQAMAEKIFRRIDKKNERFEVKLVMMNIVSRLIGVHQLYLPNFYPLLQRYLFPHQREVTKVMVYSAQAAHPLVPPEDLQPILQCLANNFVTERYSSEVMAMGLNAIREVCARNHYAMDEALLQDLVQYRTHRDKAVMMAARSLLTLFREVNSNLLLRKDRGAPSEIMAEKEVAKFGANTAKSYIPGAEILTFQAKEGESQVHDDECSSDEDEESSDEMDNNNKSNPKYKKQENLNVQNCNKAIIESKYIKEGHDNKTANDGTGSDELTDAKKHEKMETNQHYLSEKVFNKKEAIKEVLKLTSHERVQRATEVVSTRLLTDADFVRIDDIQSAKRVERYCGSKKRGQKRQLADEGMIPEQKEIVPLSSIEMIYKKRKHDKESRLQTVKEGREGREKYGKKHGKMNPHASTTNKEKRKSKSFMMMKHKFRGSQQKKSFREKQIKLRNALLKSERTVIR